MQEYDYTQEQQQFLDFYIKERLRISNQIAKLEQELSDVDDLIESAIQHKHLGQKTYNFGAFDIEIKTPIRYSLNTKLYKSGEVSLPDEFNPIKEYTSFKVDKSLYEKYMKEADDKTRGALSELITEIPSKRSIKIKV